MFGAKIERGVVTQVSKHREGADLPDGWVLSETRVGKGWTYDRITKAFTPPVKAEEPQEDEGPPEVRGQRLLARKRLEEATGMTIAQIRLALKG